MTIIELVNSKDTHLDQGREDANFGISNAVFVGKAYDGKRKRGLIRFDLSEVPENVVTVNSAVVSLMFKAETSNVDSLITFYRSLVQWYEGTKMWQPPGYEDGSTWRMRNANSLDPSAWEGGAGGGTSGDDWYATKTDDILITGVGVRYEWDVKADIEDFLDESEENFGWWVIGAEGTASSRKDFYSSETEMESYRPILTLDLSYTTGTIPADVQDCCDGSNYLLMERKGIVP